MPNDLFWLILDDVNQQKMTIRCITFSIHTVHLTSPGSHNITIDVQILWT